MPAAKNPRRQLYIAKVIVPFIGSKLSAANQEWDDRDRSNIAK